MRITSMAFTATPGSMAGRICVASSLPPENWSGNSRKSAPAPSRVSKKSAHPVRHRRTAARQGRSQEVPIERALPGRGSHHAHLPRAGRRFCLHQRPAPVGLRRSARRHALVCLDYKPAFLKHVVTDHEEIISSPWFVQTAFWILGTNTLSAMPALLKDLTSKDADTRSEAELCLKAIRPGP